jgi:hypothetical protein
MAFMGSRSSLRYGRSTSDIISGTSCGLLPDDPPMEPKFPANNMFPFIYISCIAGVVISFRAGMAYSRRDEVMNTLI